MDKNKVLYFNSAFSIKDIADTLPTVADKIDSIFIEGYASTNDIDRAGDVVPSAVWEKGIQNYLKNPIILSQHCYDDPVGRMVDYRIDKKGLWIKARVSAAAEIFNLVKDKVLTAFSIGFKVLDAEYNAAAEVFMVKELELVEISIVSVPCNQNTVFNLSKAFNTAEDYSKFKAQFAPSGTSAKGLESIVEAKSTTPKEWKMNPEELKQMLADAANTAAEQATKSLLAAQAAQVEKSQAEAKAAQELDVKIKAAVAASIQSVDSGAERLLAEVTKRFEDQNQESKAALAGLEAAISEKSAELAKIQASKMQFADNKGQTGPSYAEKEKAVLLANFSRKSMQDTKYGQELVQKYGQHLPSATWELEVSLNMEADIRRKLIVAPLFRTIDMKTNVMTIPLNPDAGLASWAQNSDFGAAASAGGTTPTTTGTIGANSPHAIKEITLNAYKVATKEYLNYEEEEDSLIVLLPFIRDAMVRRIARAIDRAFVQGGGSGQDPVKGLTKYSNTTATAVTNAVGTATKVADMRALRAKLGVMGLDPADVTFVVNQAVYYDLLEDTTFQTMNQVGVQATLLTGQIGQIGNSPVLVSGELPDKPVSGTAAVTGAWAADTNVGALALYTNNFVVGSQRGLRMDTQELVETQRRVMVASMRTGFMQLSTAYGAGVASLRYAS